VLAVAGSSRYCEPMVRVLWIVGIFMVLALAGSVLWVGLELPPLKLVAAHGFPPSGGPTGRVKEIEGIRFVEIGTGYFRMGSWFNCTKGDSLGRICKAFHLPWGKQSKEDGDEVPVRWVEIRQPYWIADCELTNAQYERFDPEHERSEFSKGNDDPVAEVRWADAQAYCKWLAARSGLSIRLPSEAEWENACRAGSRTEYAFGDDPARLDEYAWFDANADGRAHAVKMKRANAWGLYDLHGNVWEWCEDTYHKDYKGAPEDARAWTEGGVVLTAGVSPLRVMRGGGWAWLAVDCRSAGRDWYIPVDGGGIIGFRPAFSSP